MAGALVPRVDFGNDLLNTKFLKRQMQRLPDGGLSVAETPERILSDGIDDLICIRVCRFRQLYKADGGAVLQTDHKETSHGIQMKGQHRFRNRVRQPRQIGDHTGILIQEPGHLRVLQPINQIVHVFSSFASTQKNRSGFLHIAYLTVKKYLKALLACAKTVLLYEIMFSIPYSPGKSSYPAEMGIFNKKARILSCKTSERRWRSAFEWVQIRCS